MAPEEQGPVPMMGYIVQFQILTADKVAAASGMIYLTSNDPARNWLSRNQSAIAYRQSEVKFT